MRASKLELGSHVSIREVLTNKSNSTLMLIDRIKHI